MTHSPKYRSCWIAQYLEISTFYGNVFYELMAPYSMSSVSNQIRQCSLNVNNDSLRVNRFASPRETLLSETATKKNNAIRFDRNSAVRHLFYS